MFDAVNISSSEVCEITNSIFSAPRTYKRNEVNKTVLSVAICSDAKTINRSYGHSYIPLNA